MKKRGFTLIELLAVIVLLAIIAFITTPVILNIIKKANKGAFEDTAYGILRAGNLYYIKEMSKKNNKEEKVFTFPEAKGLPVQGKKPEKGYIKIGTDGNIEVLIFNEKFCAIIRNQSKANIYEKESENCEIKNIKEELEKDHIVKNVKINGEIVNKIIGTKEEKLTMKNYIWYLGNLWQVIETNDNTNSIKMISAHSLTSITYGQTNNYEQSYAKQWLNEEFLYNLETKEELVDTTFCLEEPKVEKRNIVDNVSGTNYNIVQIDRHEPISKCSKKIQAKVGMMTFEDYAYAKYGISPNYNGGSFLDEDEFEWTITPYTKENREDQLYIQWSTTAYLTAQIGGEEYSYTNSYGHGIRPIISIKGSNIIIKGTGTKQDPYILISEKRVTPNEKISKAQVGDYVYLEESNNPNPYTNETVVHDVNYSTTKEKVRYRIVKKNKDGTVKIERADILKNMPSTTAQNNQYIPYYSKNTGTNNTSCKYEAANYYLNGCKSHNSFLPTDGNKNFEINKSTGNNVGYFLNNAPNGFYHWLSDKTKSMLVKEKWNRYTSGYQKNYNNLNSNPSHNTYPTRTDDGEIEAYVGLPIWGEMYTGNDLNITYWYLNRWVNSDIHASYVSLSGHSRGTVVSNPQIAVRPVLVLKENIKIIKGEGTMTEPYILAL